MFPITDFEKKRRTTFDPYSKSAVIDYLMRIRYTNKLNYKNFTYTVLKECWFINNMVMYTKKNFFLIDEFDVAIRRLKSSGLINYWVDKFTRLEDLKVKETVEETLSLEQLQGVFEIFIYGLIISIACFLGEIIFNLLK